MSSFSELQSLSLEFSEFIIEGLKVLEEVVSFLISQPCIPNDAMLLDDLHYTKDLLIKLVLQLQPVNQKLLSFDSSDTQTMRTFVCDISEYVIRDVFDMALLTIEATAARFLGEIEVETQLRNLSLITDTMSRMNQYYTSNDFGSIRKSFNDLKAVFTSVKGETSH